MFPSSSDVADQASLGEDVQVLGNRLTDLV